MKSIIIEGREINEKAPCFIIAEAGVNHNGKIELAKKLIDAAKDAGVDAVKFQTFTPDEVVIRKAPMALYQQKNLEINKSQLELLRQCEMDYNDFKKLKQYSDKKNIIFLSTPHSEDAANFLEPLVSAYKIGSGDLTNIPFLKKVAKKGKPVIVGTGMSTLEEVKETLNTIYREGNKKVIMLHCTSNYPCLHEEVNLNAMVTMQKELDCLIGYSDHTIDLTVPIMAVTLGAVVIEKHLTLDKNMPGPDHMSSLEPDALKSMVQTIRNVEKAMGDGVKRPTKSEIEIKKLVRKSIVANKDILRGSVLKKDDLTIKRPEGGIPPKYLDNIIEKIANKNIKKDELILFRDLKGNEEESKS